MDFVSAIPVLSDLQSCQIKPLAWQCGQVQTITKEILLKKVAWDHDEEPVKLVSTEDG